MHSKGFPSQNGLKREWTGRDFAMEKRRHAKLTSHACPSEAELAFTVINFASLLTLLPSPLFLPLPVLNRRHLSHRPPLPCPAPPFRSPLFFLSFPEWRISRIARAAPARNVTNCSWPHKICELKSILMPSCMPSCSIGETKGVLTT